MVKPILLIAALIAATILSSGCIKTEVRETRYVCSDGHTVSNPKSCLPPKPQKAEEKISGVIVKYVCSNGNLVLSQGECNTPEHQTKTIIKYVCPDGIIVEKNDSCNINSKIINQASATTTTTTVATTPITSTTTTTTTKRDNNNEQDTEKETLDQSTCVNLGCPMGTKYVGSKNSDKYHRCGCRWARRIKPENIICFKSKKEAEDSEYIPCSACNLD